MTEVTPHGHLYYLLDPLEVDHEADIDLDLDHRDHVKGSPTQHEKMQTNHVHNEGVRKDFRPEVKGHPPTRPRGGSSLHNSRGNQ